MGNKLVLVQEDITAPKNLGEMMSLDSVKTSFVENYNLSHKNNNGEMVYERERNAFMQMVAENKNIENCTRMSVYGAFISLASTGLSLVNQEAYLIPYGQTLQFQVSWMGRLRQLLQLESVIEIADPEVVYKSDIFELGMLPKKHVKAHERKTQRPEDDIITHVYVNYELTKGDRWLILERQDVVRIMQGFSKSYIIWQQNKGKNKDGSPMKLPFALAFPEEYFKKTVIKKLSKQLTHTQKVLDVEIFEDVDYEEGDELGLENGSGDDRRALDIAKRAGGKQIASAGYDKENK